MYGREWTLFRGKQCHKHTAALSAPTCPSYLCSSSLGFQWFWKSLQNSGIFFNEKWGGHHSHISQKSCFASVLDFSVTMCALPSMFIVFPQQTKCRSVWQSLSGLEPLTFPCAFPWKEMERWKPPQDHHKKMGTALSHSHFHWQGRTFRLLEQRSFIHGQRFKGKIDLFFLILRYKVEKPKTLNSFCLVSMNVPKK